MKPCDRCGCSEADHFHGGAPGRCPDCGRIDGFFYPLIHHPESDDLTRYGDAHRPDPALYGRWSFAPIKNILGDNHKYKVSRVQWRREPIRGKFSCQLLVWCSPRFPDAWWWEVRRGSQTPKDCAKCGKWHKTVRTLEESREPCPDLISAVSACLVAADGWVDRHYPILHPPGVITEPPCQHCGVALLDLSAYLNHRCLGDQSVTIDSTPRRDREDGTGGLEGLRGND